MKSTQDQLLLERIKAAVRISQLALSTKTRIECPFHGSKDKDLALNHNNDTWKCFGKCGIGGDVFGWMRMKHPEMPFSTIIQHLAELGNVPLKPSTKRTEILAKAMSVYRENLATNTMARDFLLNRGITEETWFKANIGFAAGVPEGIPNKDLLSVGLVVPKTYSPVLENRIVFAIHDRDCNIVHLQGRTLGLDWRSEQKYMQLIKDTPDGVYPISHYLHGEEQLAYPMEYAFINEGIPDSLIMRQMGFYSFGTIGNQGFHIHAYKLNHLKRLYVLMDNDEASQNKVAAELARLQAKLPNTEVFNITLPKETDEKKMDTNDWYLKYRPSKYQFIEVVDNVAVPAIKLVIDTWYTNRHKHYQIAEVISTARDPERWVNYFSTLTGLPKTAINYLITVVTPLDRSGLDGPSWTGWEPFKTAIIS